MLSQLAIKNLAIIDNIEITFQSGLCVLTGETGAGKSLIIDSINTVLGAKTSKDLIRKGANSLRVEALFYAPESEFAVEGQILLCREVFKDGRNLCKINGEMANLSRLREVSENLISIHGQNDNQLLLKASNHLGYVDDFAKNSSLLQSYSELFERKQEVLKKIEHLNSLASEDEKRLDFLRFCLEEIKSANISEKEEETLREERNVPKSFEKIQRGISEAGRNLSQDGGALALVHKALFGLPDGTSEKLDNLKSSLYDAYYALEECTRDINDFADTLSADPGRLEEIEERLDVISKLKSKYGGTVSEVLQYAETAEKDILEIENKDTELSEYNKELSLLGEKLNSLSCTITESRKKAAAQIEQEIKKELFDLDMEYVKFAISHDIIPLCHNGADKMEFLISTSGDELKPLVKIASGGEMSRICLALKTVLTDKDKAETVIFDEIDSGISGKAAQKIGKKLKNLGEKCQIISITHLAQIASMGDTHFCISKDFYENEFHTKVRLLDYEGRLCELARIIGGEKITPATKAAAEEMLKN